LRLAVALIVLGCVLGAGVSAASGADVPATSERAAGVIGPRVPTIAMPTLVAPVVVSGELHHYVFLSVTLQLTRDTHKSMMLEKIPYLQDAFLREVHGPAIVKDNDPTLLDEDGLKQRLLRTSTTVVGPGIVNGIELRYIPQAVH
jgi:hypothetical protein